MCYFVRMIDNNWLLFRKSQVVKIQPIVEFVTRVEVVWVVFCLESGFFCLLFRVWEKGERWSGAREMLAWRRWRKGKLSACAPRRRTYLSSGVTCACAWARLHLVPWLPSSLFSCLMPVPSLDVAMVSEGEPVRATRVQFYRTPGTTQTKHLRRGRWPKMNSMFIVNVP